MDNELEMTGKSNGKPTNDIEEKSNKTIKYKSINLNLCISILGIISQIVYYNNFNFEQTNNCFSTLILCVATLLLVNLDTLQSCSNYIKRIGTIKIVKSFSWFSMIITIFLALIMAFYYLEVFTINEDLLIMFNPNKNLSYLNDSFLDCFNYFNSLLKLKFKLDFLNLKQYVICYGIAFGLQTLSNLVHVHFNKNRKKIEEKYNKKTNKQKNTK